MAARYRKKLTTAFQARGRSRKKPTRRRTRNMTTLHSRVVRARARAFIRTTRVRRADAIRSAVSMQMPDRLWITASGVSTRCEPPKEYGPML